MKNIHLLLQSHPREICFIASVVKKRWTPSHSPMEHERLLTGKHWNGSDGKYGIEVDEQEEGYSKRKRNVGKGIFADCELRPCTYFTENSFYRTRKAQKYAYSRWTKYCWRNWDWLCSCKRQGACRPSPSKRVDDSTRPDQYKWLWFHQNRIVIPDTFPLSKSLDLPHGR